MVPGSTCVREPAVAVLWLTVTRRDGPRWREDRSHRYGHDVPAVLGLPLHPLVVHAPVVLLPLSVLALLVMVAVPRWRPALGWPVGVALLVGTVSAFVAKLSGEVLAAEVGIPAQHEQAANTLLVLAVILLAGFVAWSPWWRVPRGATRRSSALGTTLGVALALLGLAVGWCTVTTGHSGATAVWGATAAAASPTPSAPAASTSASAIAASPSDDAAVATSSPSASDAITLAAVATHADASSCWAAIGGTVYDLTEWIDQHPGGAERILALCGGDATAAFEAQHVGQAAPAEALARFAIGTLAD